MVKTLQSKVLVLSVLLLFHAVGFAQKAPRFRKVEISTSGCTAYMPATPSAYVTSLSEDSSQVFKGFINHEGYTFGVIAVQFRKSLNMLVDDREKMLISYMDFLKTQFKIKEAVGYGKGHKMGDNLDGTGVVDYWQDENGNHLSVKGWINNDYLGFLYISGTTEYPNSYVEQLFLNSLRFPKK